MTQQVLKKLLDEKVVAIIRGIPADSIVNLTQSLIDGGITCVEVTFDQTSTESINETKNSIMKIKNEFGNKICIGAGTVMTVEQVNMAYDVGAEYIISPNVDDKVIKETKELKMISIPGALTPSEVVYAYNLGADIVKMFPAGMLGPEYVKAVKSPLKHIPVIAVGGINPKNCMDYIKAGCIGVGVGGNLVDPTKVKLKKWNEITAIAKEYKLALSE